MKGLELVENKKLDGDLVEAISICTVQPGISVKMDFHIQNTEKKAHGPMLVVTFSLQLKPNLFPFNTTFRKMGQNKGSLAAPT